MANTHNYGGAVARPEKQLTNEATAAGALGALLRNLRHSAGLSQTDLAQFSGCTPATVGQIERGRFLPSLELLIAFERHLGQSAGVAQLWEQAVLAAHEHRASNH
jgi:transcriptional regulator with XRE-family HTH domain